MLSISNPKSGGNGSGYYFSYYEDQSCRGAFWFGTGKELLGLPESVEKRAFNNLLNGFSKDGKTKLVQNAGADKRQGFWDCTFSVPKPVSALVAADPETYEKPVLMAVENSLRAALRMVEEAAGFSRQGKAGKFLTPAALTFAVFQHLSSRAGDPQIHYHAVLINLGVRPDGTSGALYTNILFHLKTVFGAVFQTCLISELKNKVGLEIIQEKVGFNIVGVPKSLCDTFSKRGNQIKTLLEKRGQQGGKAAKIAALDSRGEKKTTKVSELFKQWSEVCEEHGFGKAKAKELSSHSRVSQSDRGVPNVANRAEKIPNVISQQITSEEIPKKAKESTEKERVNKPKQTQEFSEKESASSEKIQAKSKALFEKELRKVTDKIFPEFQTEHKILPLAYKLAQKHGVARNLVPEAVEKLHLPKQHRFYRIEWKPLVAKSPSWNKIGRFRTPRIVLRNKPRKWGKVLWEKNLPTIWKKKALRIQHRKFFPNAPSWNPASKLSLPAIHIGKQRDWTNEKARTKDFERVR